MVWSIRVVSSQLGRGTHPVSIRSSCVSFIMTAAGGDIRRLKGSLLIGKVKVTGTSQELKKIQEDSAGVTFSRVPVATGFCFGLCVWFFLM